MKISSVWRYVRPVAFGGLGYLAARHGFDLLVDPAWFSGFRESLVVQGLPLGSFLQENVESLFRTGAGITGAAVLGLASRKLGEVSTTRAVAGLALTPLVLGAVVQDPPLIARSAYHRLRGVPSIDEVLREEVPPPGRVADLVAWMGQHPLSVERLEEDAAYLNQYEFDGVSAYDLYVLARTVAIEGGHYDGDRSRLRAFTQQREDMRAVTHNILNRYVTARAEPHFRRIYNGPGEVTFAKIAQRDGQFSAATRRRQRLWEEGFTARDPYHGIDRDPGIEDLLTQPTNEAKVARAYLSVLTVLDHALREPLDDPTQGSLMYKNTTITPGRVWHGLTEGEYTRMFTARIGDHWHYRIEDGEHNNIALDARKDFFLAQPSVQWWLVD